MAGIEIEPGAMAATSQKVAVLIEELPRCRVERRALMRAGVFERVEMFPLARNQNRPEPRYASLFDALEHEADSLTIGDIRSPADSV